MNPVFFHDPRKGDTLEQRLSLEGNPDILQDWTTHTITYVDSDGMTQLKEVAFTPADFALFEGRFKKHFTPISDDQTTLELAEFVTLNNEQRAGKTPFIWGTDPQHQLIKLSVSSSIIALTEERLRNWRMLQYLSGHQIHQLEGRYQADIEKWKALYHQSVEANEQAIDDMANGLAELASLTTPTTTTKSDLEIPVTQLDVEDKTESSQTQYSKPLVAINEQDQAQCTDCKTCYQQLPELFEKTTIVKNGSAKVVSRVIPNALQSLVITPEIIERAARIADECDAEIIHFTAPSQMEV
jgi:pyruvate-ferredoxin/flavodoxin oxidoreductase